MSLKLHAVFLAAAVIATPVLAQDENTPPRLVANVNLQVALGSDTTVTQNNLRTVDTETTDPTEITYTIFPGEPEVTFPAGVGLYLGSTQLKGNSTFTQADVNAGRLHYRAPNSVDDPGFKLPFNVRDFEGALARDGMFTVFAMSFGFINTPPVAQNGSAEVSLGGTFTNLLAASSAESYQQLTYSLVTQPTKGTVQLMDAATGAFRYTAREGESGQDSFTFQVFDGFLNSVNPGTFTISIANQTPVVPSQVFSVPQNLALSAQIAVNDPDLPQQRLRFIFVSGPKKGVIENFQASGHFTYNPNPGRFGTDSFVVAATDGEKTSASQTIYLQIKPFIHDGLVVMTGRDSMGTPDNQDDKGGIFVLNPASGDAGQIVEGDFLREALGLAFDFRHNEVVFAAVEGQMKIVGGYNVSTEELRPISINNPLLEFPFWITTDKEHNLLLANGPGGIVSINSDTGNAALVQNSKPGVVTAFQQNDNGTYLVLDAVEIFADNAQLYILNPATGTREIISEDPRFLDLVDVITLPNGDRLLAARGGIFRVNLGTKEVTRVMDASAFGMLPKSMIMLPDGQVLISDLFNKLIRLNPETAQFSTVTLDRTLIPGGLALIKMPATWDDWQKSIFNTAELADEAQKETLWGANADPDKDGLPNFVEFAEGTHPLSKDARIPLNVRIGKSDRGTFPWVSFRTRKESSGINYALQASNDLQNWETITATVVDTEELGSSLQQVTFEITNPAQITGVNFYRLQITAPDGLTP